MATAPARILVFDSGLGGTTILEALQRDFPACSTVYCSDNAAFPYGTKTESDVIARVGHVLKRLDADTAPDILVIACNTASTVALPVLRSLIRSPVVGVVPGIKPAAHIARTPCIGLLATPGTIKRDYTQSLITEFGQGFEWIKVGSSELVQLAEQKLYGTPPAQDAITEILAPFAEMTEQQLDTIVLACTHFPLLKMELQQALPSIRNWVDSTDAIARRVGFWLKELHLEGTSTSSAPSHELIFTRQPEQAQDIKLLTEKFGIVKTRLLEI